MAAGVDALERTESEGRAGGSGERAELVAVRLTELERLGNRERPVPEVRLRPDELDVDTLLCERAQRESGLQRCDTTTGDEDPLGHQTALDDVTPSIDSHPRKPGLTFHPQRAAPSLRIVRKPAPGLAPGRQGLRERRD